MTHALPSPELLRPALRYSRFAQRLLDAHPAFEEEVRRAGQGTWPAEEMRVFLSEASLEEGKLESRLRELRARVMLRMALRDLSGLASLNEVVQTMSDLAEVTLQTAHRFHRSELVAQHGEPLGGGRSQDLLVLGMGKLGGRELNVSSDIDLIFVYPQEGETAGPRKLSNLEFFSRLGQRLIRSLNEVTAEGFVFRVDMRLRPWGDGGALACSFDALEQYFVSHGREWERYAWIKARVVAGGDEASCAALQQLVRPFVYRKYLDYGSIAAVRALHVQIRQEVARREMRNHIKLGPGGIREIEFIAQAFQLIRGGRDSSLRERSTLKLLSVLGLKHLLQGDAVAELTNAYTFLRRLEHRLQYLEDAQTHQLPTGEAEQTLIAQAMGCTSWQELMDALGDHRAAVTRHFEAIFAEQPGESNELACVWATESADEQCVAQLGALGFSKPAAALERLGQFRKSPRYQTLPASSQSRVDALVPAFIDAAAKTAVPDATLARVIDFLEGITKRAAYLALLHESPQALKRVAEILGTSTWAATYLSRHPAVLDELLDLRQLHTPPDWSEFALALRREMTEHAGDTERQMDLMRELHHAQIFRLLAQDVAGLLTVEKLADHLSLAADLVVTVALEECWKLVRNRHIESPRIAIIGYGKLGGKELGYASDLDLVFVYDDPNEAAQENYARLVQRMNTWLSSVTAAGTLFEVDLRLRPNGDAGLLANNLAAFRKYQNESAWPWEHQALTRARFVTGDAAAGALFEALRRDVLTAERDLDKLRTDILAMREKMREGHPNRSKLFDLKHDPGGMVDIEFIVQYLVLAHAREHYELSANLGNIALLHMAGALKLIPNALAGAVANAYRSHRRAQHKLRLNGAEYARVESAQVATEAEATLALWGTIFGTAPRSAAQTRGKHDD